MGTTPMVNARHYSPFYTSFCPAISDHRTHPMYPWHSASEVTLTEPFGHWVQYCTVLCIVSRETVNTTYTHKYMHWIGKPSFNWKNYLLNVKKLLILIYQFTNDCHTENAKIPEFLFRISATDDGQQLMVPQNQSRRISQTTTSASHDCEYQMADSAKKTR